MHLVKRITTHGQPYPKLFRNIPTDAEILTSLSSGGSDSSPDSSDVV